MGAPSTELRTLWKGLDDAFERALEPVRGRTEPLGVLYSGGVDSSVLAWELRGEPRLTLCTLGGADSADLAAGRAGAERLGLPWQPMGAAETEVTGTGDRFKEDLSGLSPVSRLVLLSLACAIDQASPGRLVCGQGVDELFLGYAHFRDLDAVQVERRSREDLDRLLATDWPRTQRIAARAGKTIEAPFLDPKFIERASQVPISLRLPRDRPKGFFRDWAIHRGLPPELANRAKKALQYGSGVARVVRTLYEVGR